MSDNGRGSSLSDFANNLIARVVVYYVGLAAAITVVWMAMPAGTRTRVMGVLSSLMSFQLTPTIGAQIDVATGMPVPQVGAPPFQPILLVVIAITSAFLLALPVAWVYMFTRQRKGYRAADVQALVLLPVVVSGVVVLVKNSLALAFGLAGIVAAVRFRTNLEDSKDATFVFLATALGLACGVQLEVAAVLSILFNAAVLILWTSDFARLPPALEGVRAKRQLERALAIANRTSQFVARLDHEVLEALAPAQLDALEDRLRRRRAELAGESAGPGSRFDAMMRILTSDPTELRAAIDPVLETEAKRWRYRGSSTNEIGTSVEYDIRLRKGYSRQSLAEVVREKGAPYVVGVEIVEVEETERSEKSEKSEYAE
ncbi:MAG TPA: DUF4956 domain-containing protein [Gemmatimonadaceae bacterium]|jgi:hypothetical protein|nr:DUF4956 domain-containing protein [Gemmatimonadaceae bacterium]